MNEDQTARGEALKVAAEVLDGMMGPDQEYDGMRTSGWGSTDLITLADWVLFGEDSVVFEFDGILNASDEMVEKLEEQVVSTLEPKASEAPGLLRYPAAEAFKMTPGGQELVDNLLQAVRQRGGYSGYPGYDCN